MFTQCSRAYLQRIRTSIKAQRKGSILQLIASCFQYRDYSKKIIKKPNSIKQASAKEINVEQIHKPVLLNEVLEKLSLKENGGLIIDATLGLGGYTKQILCKFTCTSAS